MKVKLTRKVLTILMSLMMVGSMMLSMALTAFADTGSEPVAQIGETKYATLQEAVNAAATDGSTTDIVMLANTEEATVTIPTNTKIVLDLAGKTITGKLNINQVVCDLTINDSEGGGGITSSTSNAIYIYTNTSGKVNLTINGGNFAYTGTDKTTDQNVPLKITAQNTAANMASTVNITGGTFTSSTTYGANVTLVGAMNISGGTFTGATQAALRYSGKATSSNKLTITGNPTFTGSKGLEVSSSGNVDIQGGTYTALYTSGYTGGVYCGVSDAVLTISGGSFNYSYAAAKSGAAYLSACNATISGGTFTNTAEGGNALYYGKGINGSLRINGSNEGRFVGGKNLDEGAPATIAAITFDQNPGTTFYANYTGRMISEGNWRLGRTQDFVKVGETTYEDIYSLMQTAGETYTAELLGDYPETVTIPAGKTLTLDLKGHTITGKLNVEGTLTLKDSVGTGGMAYDGTTNALLEVYNNASLTIEGGTYICNDHAPVRTSGTTYTFGSSPIPTQPILNIKGGTIRYTGTVDSCAVYCGGATVTVSGGTIESDHSSAFACSRNCNIEINENNGPVVIRGGIIDAESNGQAIQVIGKENSSDIVCDLVVKGGTFTGRDATLWLMADMSYKLEGGTYNVFEASSPILLLTNNDGPGTNDNHHITGGIYHTGSRLFVKQDDTGKPSRDPIITGGTFNNENTYEWTYNAYNFASSWREKFTKGDYPGYATLDEYLAAGEEAWQKVGLKFERYDYGEDEAYYVYKGKETSMFPEGTQAEGYYIVPSTVVTTGNYVDVVDQKPVNYVAQIGTDDSIKKYESLDAAIAENKNSLKLAKIIKILATNDLDVNTELELGEFFLVDDYTHVKYPDGYYCTPVTSSNVVVGYKIGPAVASITKNSKTTYYETLNKATTDAQNGDTVVLLKDLYDHTYLHDYEAMASNKTITINLNSHKIDGYYSYGAIILDSANVTVTDSAVSGNSALTNNYTTTPANAVFMQNANNTLNIENVKIQAWANAIQFQSGATNGTVTVGENATVTSTARSGIYNGAAANTNSTININGGTVKSAPSYYGIWVAGANSIVTVNNGTVTGGTYGIMSYAANNTITIKGESNVSGKYAIWLYEADNTVNVEGGTVIGGDKMGILINGANCTANITGGTVTSTNSSSVQIQGANSKIMVSGGTVIATGEESTAINLLCTGCIANITGGTVSGKETGIYSVSDTQDARNKITVDGGTVTAGDYGIAIFDYGQLDVKSGSITATEGHALTNNGSYTKDSIVNISGGTITGGTRGEGFYHAGPGTLNITGGTISGKTGVEMRAGTINVSGGTLESTATEYECDANANGPTTQGAALAIAQHVTKIDITANITGGTFKGIVPVNECNPQENDPAPRVDLTVSDGEFWSTATENAKVFSCVDCSNFINGGFFSHVPDTKYIAPDKSLRDTTEAEKSTHGEQYLFTLGAIPPVAPSVEKDATKNSQGIVPDETQEDFAGEVINKVISEISDNTSVSEDGATNIQDVVTDEKFKDAITSGNVVDSSAQLKITVKSVATQTTATEVTAITAQTVTTTKAKYDVKPYVTIATTTETGTTTETRKITNQELKDAGVSIQFRLAVPASMKSGTVLVKHYNDGSNTPDWAKPYKVQGSGNNRYVQLEANAFSIYELEDTEIQGYVAYNMTKQKGYETLAAAVAEASDEDTIKLLKNESGDGIVIPENRFTNGLTIDLGGNTYAISGNLVGSTGTETNGFQILPENKVTIKDGTIESNRSVRGTTSEGTVNECRILIQNYSDLTLEGVTLDGRRLQDSREERDPYTLSNNSGDVVLDNSTITAASDGIAFDTCKYGSYDAPTVTVQNNTAIEGDVELAGGSLNLLSGTLDGKLLKTAAGIAVGEVVQRDPAFDATAPEGFMWNTSNVLVQKNYVAEIVDTTEDTTTYTKFYTAAEALAAVTNAETQHVRMIDDSNESTTHFVLSHKLDLNGHELQVASMLVLNEGKILDSEANRPGLLGIKDKMNFAISNPQDNNNNYWIPVWYKATKPTEDTESTTGTEPTGTTEQHPGYKFVQLLVDSTNYPKGFKTNIVDLPETTDTNGKRSAKIYFQPQMNLTDWSVVSGGDISEIKFSIYFGYIYNGKVQDALTYEFDSGTIKQYANAMKSNGSDYGLYLEVRGSEKLTAVGESLSMEGRNTYLYSEQKYAGNWSL